MVVAQFAAVFGGIWLVLMTVLSAVRTIVLPRSSNTLITRSVFLFWRRVFRFVARPSRPFSTRDRTMSLYAPVGMLTLAGTWMALALIGFMLIFWGLGYGSIGESYWASGSSLLTLGTADIGGIVFRTIAIVEAMLGLGFVALLIAFLPVLYTIFSRRENAVSTLEVRAGSPPSAVEMLVRLHRIDRLKDMENLWGEWESWFADVSETHTSYPALTFLRSPDREHSWVTSAGTVLDAASLSVSTLDIGSQPDARLCIRSGYVALRKVAAFFGVSFDPDPNPDDPIAVAKTEYEAVYEQLAEAGLPVVPDREHAWRDYAGWRVNYDTVLLALAELTMAPYAPWSSDRSAPDHARPRVTRWGSRSLRQ